MSWRYKPMDNQAVQIQQRMNRIVQIPRFMTVKLCHWIVHHCVCARDGGSARLHSVDVKCVMTEGQVLSA
jgi:hypothetical protein